VDGKKVRRGERWPYIAGVCAISGLCGLKATCFLTWRGFESLWRSGFYHSDRLLWGSRVGKARGLSSVPPKTASFSLEELNHKRPHINGLDDHSGTAGWPSDFTTLRKCGGKTKKPKVKNKRKHPQANPNQRKSKSSEHCTLIIVCLFVCL
jgi:hypothetical protein